MTTYLVSGSEALSITRTLGVARDASAGSTRSFLISHLSGTQATKTVSLAASALAISVLRPAPVLSKFGGSGGGTAVAPSEGQIWPRGNLS